MEKWREYRACSIAAEITAHAVPRVPLFVTVVPTLPLPSEAVPKDENEAYATTEIMLAR